MRIKLPVLVLFILLLRTYDVFATHIVGGSLTYIYNGGSNYTITLKLYRDCSPTSAAFPGSVTIDVVGFNGEVFTPSRNITMNLGTITPVPANLDPCALPPNPLPCVQEGIYTTTVNNLPPNAGGYHLSYQIVARNLSLSNVDAVCNCVGESFYAYIPGTTVQWDEDFALANNTTTDAGSTAWTIAAGVPPPASASVINNRFEITGANDGRETWTSQVINSSSCSSFSARVDLAENGNFEANDSILVYYRLNGGPLIPFPTNGFMADDFTNAVASVSGLSGATIQIVVRVHYDANSPASEIYRFDNVVVSCDDFQVNSNPVFNLFPPLFLCLGNPFTFNHAATDADGDSLHYSFYTPYNGDTGPGPLDPTFAGNTATFTPIVWEPGFSITNPLGGPPLNLNPNTGLLTGTPTMLGQFVVGVVVKEYRNGNYISQTLRDFQFNIVNCPPPPVAVGGTNITINDGCIGTLTATGFNVPTVTWNSITGPTPGAYNSYLSCTSGCVNPTVVSSGTPPPFVDYMVCGISANCNPTLVCDTVRVTFNPTLSVTIAPLNPTICFGQTSTTITATGGGGTPPYSYLWNSVNPSPSINVGAGNYTVMLSDASGCPPVYNTVTVTSFSVAITANAGPNDTVCLQSPVATLQGSVTGAAGGIWSGGGGTFSPNNTTLTANYTPTAGELAVGFVDLTLTTTGNGTCPAGSDVVRIYFLGFTGTVAITKTNVTCFGAANGTATATITAGAPPYTYFWNTTPAQTTATASNLAPGTYTVTIQNAAGCSTQSTVTITQPTPLALTRTITNVSCFGGSNGSIAVTPSGGTPAYTYVWAPGGFTTSTISGRPAGTYTVTVTDSRGCTITANYTITQPPTLAITFTRTNVSCFGGNNGTATGTVTGGTAPYTYNWAPSGGTASTASGLGPNTYTLTVTDNRGCIRTGTVVITQPTVLNVTVSSTNETCSTLNNGTATVTPSGGTPGYTYLWSPGGMTTASVTGLSSGTYTVAVTDSRGCVNTVFATITQPTILAVTINKTNVNCFGGSTGTAIANPSGGTAPYTYLWAPGAATTNSISGLAAGTYTVTVTDNSGCQIQNTTTITEPAAALSVNAVVANVSCASGTNGSIVTSVSGGTAPYSYLWTPGGQTTANLNSRPAGTYGVTVTDSRGCQTTATYVITQPLTLAITFTKTNVSCFGGNNGTATGNVTGGTPPYSYNWSPTGGTGPTASGLSVGSYTLSVTDNRGCVRNTSVNITQPTLLTCTATRTNETCSYLNNGTAQAHPAGGSPGYTYLWMPGGMTTQNVSSLSSGTYTVTITDTKGCTATATAIINQPVPLAITFNFQSNVSCFGGSNGALSASPSGGTPGYSYLWMPGGNTSNSISGLSAGTYTLTVTDISGCQVQSTPVITQPSAPVSVSNSATPVSCFGGTNGTASAVGSGGTGPYTYLWMPGSLTGSNVSGLSAGTYTVTATDSQGCTGTNTVIVNQPSEIILTTSTINSNCGTPSGEASVAVAGGVGPYTYLWAPAGGTGPTADSLSSGAYTIVVTDVNGCSSTQWANVNDNSAPTATIFNVINVSCNGGTNGSASVGVAGGTGPFTYLWTPFGGTDSVAAGLSAGTYTVTVIDAIGCLSNATTSPAITEPPPIIISVTTTSVNCLGGNDGTATAVASGGTPGYTYLWLPGGTPGDTVSGLSASTYTVQVTDANSCVQNLAFSVSQPATAVSVSMSSNPVSCFSGNDGSASALGSGGTAPYNYSWMPGSGTGSSIGGLTVGTYTVTVIDANGCSVTNTVAVTQPTAVVVTLGSNNSSCGAASGVAYVTASGGIGPYDYLWYPGGIMNDTAISLLPGTYNLTVADNNGCTVDTSIVVNDNAGPVATITATTNVSCNGGSNGTATVTLSGGSAPFSYSWTPSGGTGPVASGLPAGSYSITVTDANGCIAIDTTSPDITEPPPLATNLTALDVSCFGGNDGTATAMVFGGTPGYTFTWLPGGATGPSIGSLTAGTYTVTVTDLNSCTHSNTVQVNQPTVLNAVISSSTNVSCFGGDNGTATVSASGGTPFYSYNWLPTGGTGATGVGLSAGTYTVTVTDLNNCTTNTTVLISEPTAPLSVSATGTATSCFGGSDGTATAIASGGALSYFYFWAPSGGLSATAVGLSSGNYTVLVVDSSGCVANASVFITEPSQVSGTLLVTQPSCGSANGVINSMITGGTAPYTYLWAPGAETTADITGLLPGPYSLMVTDNEGCTSNYSTTLTNIPGPGVSIPVLTNATCFGGNDGTATASVTGGTSPYSFNWLPYGGTSITGTGFTAGTFTVEVTDSLGCIASDSVSIGEPTPVNVNVSSLTSVSCNGGANGSITVNGTGGTPGYTYSWSPISSTSSTVSGLSSGTYAVTVSDTNSCQASISINISEPTILVSSVGTVTNTSCFGGSNGSASIIISGGVTPYSCLWSDGQTGSTASNLSAGTYTVVTTDINGCTSSNSVTIAQPSQVITSAGTNDTLCLGTSGIVTATASGGVGPYFYTWLPGGIVNAGSYTITPLANTTYTVIAYDADGCAGTTDTVSAIVYTLSGTSIDAITTLSPICPGQSSSVFVTTSGSTGALTYSWNNGLGAGPGIHTVSPIVSTTYIVSVTNSCGVTVSDSVAVVISPPPTVVLSVDTNEICAPSCVQFFDNSVTGNVADPIHYWHWDFGDGTTSALQDPIHCYSQPGTYPVQLTITTGNGCTNSNTSTPLMITAYPYPIAAFTTSSTELSLPYDVLNCDNQSVGAISYIWFFGDGGSSTAVDPSYLYTTVGSFTVTLISTNNYGCSDTAYSHVTTNADVIFPNVFTPGTEGSNGGSYVLGSLDNDIFFPYTSGVEKFKLEIFNRWGELIFVSEDVLTGWDGYYKGKLCEQDVYIWKAYIELNNGKKFNKSGDVTLLR